MALKAAASNALGLFGLMVVVGVAWQRVVGTVEVAPMAATLLVAAVAGGVSFHLEGAVRRAYFAAVRPA